MNLRKAAGMALEIIEGEWPADDEIASPVMYTLREALAQPEQEPVAWMMFGVDKPTRVILHKPSDEHKKVFSCIFPLYTHEEPNEYGLRGESLYLHPAPIPEGWKLVPKEPTESVILAGCEIDLEEETPEHYRAFVAKMYRAMLDATPEYKP